MAAYPLPSNNPSAPIPRVGSSDKTAVNILKNTFEANYLQVRRSSSRSRKVFSLTYTTLTLAEFTILETFFNANVGTIFDFLYPIDNVTYRVTFSSGELERKFVTNNIVDVTPIILESI